MWNVIKSKETIHIVPSNDIKEHELTSMCWCNPETDKHLNYVEHKVFSDEYPEEERDIN